MVALRAQGKALRAIAAAAQLFSAEVRSRTRRPRYTPRRVFVTTRTFGTTRTAFRWRETWIDARHEAVKG
jgi:hypothetical protein